MEIGEILTLSASDIYQHCLAVFKERGIPPTLAVHVLDKVSRLVLESALNETTKNLSELDVQYAMLKAAMNEGEKKDGDTA